MSVDREKHALAHLVLNRFGLGARPGSVERIARTPRAALEAELDRGDSAAIPADRLPSTREP